MQSRRKLGIMAGMIMAAATGTPNYFDPSTRRVSSQHAGTGKKCKSCRHYYKGMGNCSLHPKSYGKDPLDNACSDYVKRK